MSQFACEEIILPRGPHEGERYDLSVFPAAKIWFDILDSGQFVYHVATGPTQSGKTLNCFIIPILHRIFELKESVIVGVPKMDVANDKWRKDIKPVIDKSRYAHLLPVSGEGSKGGKVRTIEFQHGPTITFMSFGGDDKQRASETTRNVIITETDGGNEASTTSQETNPIEQLVERAGAFDDEAFIVLECTVTTKKGQTWKRYSDGTASRLIRPCHACEAWVTPERKHFKGWEQAENEVHAGQLAHFICPECETPWTDKQRRIANSHSKIVHKGQDVTPAGEVVGPSPPTYTFGFRWTAIDNPFRSAKWLGVLEYKASRDVDADAAQKKLDQFHHAIPWTGDDDDEEKIDPYVAAHRIGETNRREVPLDYELVTLGTDIRKREAHYVAVAWQPDATSRVIDYGTVKVHSNRMAVEKAITVALRYIRDKIIRDGFGVSGGNGIVFPTQWWIDAGWKSRRVYTFVNECKRMDRWNNRVHPVAGRGQSQQYKGRYSSPRKKSKEYPHVGEEFYFSWQKSVKPMVALCLANADHWKSFAHDRFTTPVTVDVECDQCEGVGCRECGDTGLVAELVSGAMDFFIPETGDHFEFTRHLAAEYSTEIWDPNKGSVRIWKTVSRVNHYFDALYVACAAARFAGVEVQKMTANTAAQTTGHDVADNLITPDGRSFYD